MRSVSGKAVAIGGVTDILTTCIVSLPIAVYLVTTSPEGSADPAFAISSGLQSHPRLLAAQLLLGSGCSMLGGYVAARIAKRDEVVNGLLSSFIGVALAGYSLAFDRGAMPIWQHLVFAPLSPAFGALGGYLRSARGRS